MNSDNDDDEQSSDGFKKGVDFGKSVYIICRTRIILIVKL